MKRWNWSRREFLRNLMWAPAGLAACQGVETGKGSLEAERYNILLIQSDEHSPHALGCYGNRVVKTPSLDALARNGVLFSAAYCQNPVCVPSRMSMVTGKMASDVDVFGNSEPLGLEHKTFADTFNAAGYKTAIIGKMHFQGKGEERTHGFDRPFGDSGSRVGWDSWRQERMEGKTYLESRLPKDACVADWPVEAEQDSGVTKYSLQFLEEHKDQPFFLISSFRKPHFPFTVQQPYFDLYKDSADLPPETTQEMLDDLSATSKDEREKYGFAELNDEQIRIARAHYYGMVTYIDDQIASILGKLDELGLREKTIILYTADHGEMMGEHGLWYKNCFYESGVGIPFIWSLPNRLPKGKHIDAPAMNLDIFPTLCELCGLEPPEGLQGRSLVPLMDGVEDGRDRVAFSENFRAGLPGRMIRTYRWKYCYFTDGKEHLFDMQNDPEERQNLAAEPEHQPVLQKLKEQALAGWNQQGYFKVKKKRKEDSEA